MTGSFFAPSGDATYTDWHVVASSGEQIADGTGSAFTFTPGNAGSYTVIFTVIDPNVGWESADAVITSEDVPPVLTAPTAAQSTYAGVSTSINLATLTVKGVGPFADVVQWGDGQTLDLLTVRLRAALDGSHLRRAWDLHDRRHRRRVRRRLRELELLDRRDHCRHVDDAQFVGSRRGLRPNCDLHGHGGRPGRPDGAGGVLQWSGHAGRSDRHRNAHRGERPQRGHTHHIIPHCRAAVHTASRLSMPAIPTTWAVPRTPSTRRSPRPAR